MQIRHIIVGRTDTELRTEVEDTASRRFVLRNERPLMPQHQPRTPSSIRLEQYLVGGRNSAPAQVWIGDEAVRHFRAIIERGEFPC